MSETADNRIHEDAHEQYVEGEEDAEMSDDLKARLDEIANKEDPIEQQNAADNLSEEE